MKWPKSWRGEKTHTHILLGSLCGNFFPTGKLCSFAFRHSVQFRNQRRYKVNLIILFTTVLKNCSCIDLFVYWNRRQRKHKLWKKWINKYISNHITNTLRKPEGAEHVKVGVWLKSSIDIKALSKCFQPCDTLLAIEKKQRELARIPAWDQARIFKNFLLLKAKRS